MHDRRSGGDDHDRDSRERKVRRAHRSVACGECLRQKQRKEPHETNEGREAPDGASTEPDERQSGGTVESDPLAGKRRAEEMRESANTVREAGFHPVMAAAIADKQQWVADQARDGVADVVWTLPGYTAGRFPKIEVFELPFMMTNAEATSRAA